MQLNYPPIKLRKGYELNYSDNCKNKFGIGVNSKGIFQEYRFN